MVKHPKLEAPISEVQASPLAGTPRLHNSHITEEKKKEIEKKIKQIYQNKNEKIEKTPRQIV